MTKQDIEDIFRYMVFIAFVISPLIVYLIALLLFT